MQSKLKKLLLCLFQPAYRRALLRHGVAAAIEHESQLRTPQHLTIVDVGANRGQFALVARRLSPAARIISFEPLPVPARQFEAIFARDDRVTLHQVAIGPRQSQATIHVSKRDDSSSLLPIGELQARVFPGTHETDAMTIDVGSLQDFIRREDIEAPALLKIDVQGYELESLRGCESLLDRFAYIYVECSFMELYIGQALADQVIAWLSERRFRLAGIYDVAYDRDGQAVQADFLFRSAAL